MAALASSITRRTVLGMFSVAGVLFTSGCSGAIVSAPAKPALAENPSAAESTTPESDETAPPSASPTSAAKDYSGEAKLEKYDTSAGPYEPATKEHPAKNVPKPVVPEHMYEDSVAGMHATIAYYASISLETPHPYAPSNGRMRAIKVSRKWGQKLKTVRSGTQTQVSRLCSLPRSPLGKAHSTAGRCASLTIWALSR